jgi:hypothetical protein
MRIIEWIVIGLLLFLATIVLLFARRAYYARAGGTIRCDLRVTTMLVGRGWSPGFARFVGDACCPGAAWPWRAAACRRARSG